MAATDPHKLIGQLHRARKLIAAIDSLVDEAMPTGTLLERYAAAEGTANRLSNNAWAELAVVADIRTAPSKETIQLVHLGLSERIRIDKRHQERNFGNNVTPIR